jgi:cytochrome b561
VTDAEDFMTYGTLPPGGYPASSKWLHWLVALSVLTTVPIGLLLPYLAPGPTQDGLYNFHKSLGILILVLMVLRVLNRFAVGAPAPEPGLARWQRAVSSAVHGALYLLLIVQPIVGYWANSAFGAATPVFGLFQIPAMVATDQAFAERLFALHRWIGILIALLVAMHIGAALQHFLIFRDSVLQRMLPRALGGR